MVGREHCVKGKYFLIGLFGLLACAAMMFQSLDLALYKNFWHDEVYEFIEPLAAPPLKMLKDGVYGTPSPNPLYYMFQREFVKHALTTELKNGKGFDWRVSIRFFSSLSLALCCFIAMFLALRIHWVLALCLPVFLPVYLATYFAAESRTYAFWLGLSLINFALSLLFCLEPENKRRGGWWLFSTLLLSLTCLTALVQIWALGTFMILAAGFFIRKKFPKILSGFVAAGFIISFAIFAYYNAKNPYILASKATFKDRLMNIYFYRHSLDELHLIRVSALLIFVGIMGFANRQLKFSQAYVLIAALGVSQVLAVLAIYAAQIYSAYWFEPRHGVFIIASQTLGLAALTLFIYELLQDMNFKFFSLKSFSLRPGYFNALFIAAILLPWIYFKAGTAPKSMRLVKSTNRAYCHGAIWLPKSSETEYSAKTKMPVFEINKLNEARHTGHCDNPVLAPDGETYRFEPEWIYGAK